MRARRALTRTGRASSLGTTRAPAHAPSGLVLLALRLGEEARGVRGVDVLRRSVDRAPPVTP